MGNTLEAAKSAGKLGEGPDGYLHVVDAGTTEAEALANSINAKRKAKYQGIASNQGLPLESVATQAGKKLIDRTPAGQYIMNATGGWIKK